MQFFIDINVDNGLSPTHIGGEPLSPFERTVLAALHQLHHQQEDNMTKTSEALAALAAAETTEENEITILLADFGSLSTQVTTLTALVATLQSNPEDANNAAAIAATTASIQAITDKITATVAPAPPADQGGGNSDTGATTQGGGTGDDSLSGGQGTDSVGGADTSGDTTQGSGTGDDSITSGAGADTLTGGDQGGDPQGAAAVTFSPTSLTGTVASPISGSFSASDGRVYTYVSDDAVPGITVAGDGFFATAVSVATTGSFSVTPTDPDGVALPPFSVSVSITDA